MEHSIDRETVIQGLEQFKADLKPFCGNHADWGKFDAGLALLKEQEAVEPEWYDGTPFCGNCGHRLEKKNRNMKEIKCPTCGRTVKWNG